MTNSHHFPLLAAGLFGLGGVALGAFGAHGLQATLAERGMTHAWESAARYQLVHTVALLGLAAWLRAGPSAGTGRLLWAARCWCAGIVLFSGSLYWLAAGGPRWLGPVTPFGGIGFMAGWLLVALAALSAKERPDE
jgi:uncharacterized membrane protein YgdD (TMEM256/DUF423 family)